MKAIMNLHHHSKIWLAIVFASMALSACGNEPAEEAQPIRPVRYERVMAIGGNRVRTFAGTAQSGKEASLSFKVAGNVTRILVEVGQHVRLNQLIAEIDPADYQLKVQQAQANLTQARSQERRAAAEYERIEGLYESNAASRSDLDAARAAFESATAAIQAAESQLELAEQQVRYTRLYAPADGLVSQVHVSANENVRAGQPIATLTSGEELDVEVAVPEIFISSIQVGDVVSVSFNALPGENFEAQVREVGVAATRATTYTVTARLTQRAPDLRSGMACEVTFQIETADQRERLIVPPEAIGEDREGRFAFVIEPDEENLGSTHRRSVETGEITEEGLEVISGLTEGELVVTAGISRIREGQIVRLLAR